MEGFLYRLRRGSAARELIRLLSLERKTGPSFGSPHLDIGPPGTSDSAATAPNNAEISVLISVNDTLAHRDRRAGRSLTRRQKKLVAAAHTSKSAAIQLEAARADPRWMNSDQAQFSSSGTAPDNAGIPPGDQPHDRRTWIGRDRRTQRTGDGQSFQEQFDPHEPLIVQRGLSIIEAVLVLVEFAFWYNVFSENLNAHAPILDPARISDVLRAVMVPLSGIVTARVVGPLVHRVVSRYPGIGRKEYIGAVVSVAVAAFAVIAIFDLVHARFAAAQLGATRLPALAMTLIFIVVLLGDMVARVFLVSEIRAQTVKWLRHLGKLREQAASANRAHSEAWLDLRNAVQRQLDEYERVVSSGARIISDQRSRAATAAPRLPAAPTQVRFAHFGADGAAGQGQGAVPSAEQLCLYDARLVLGPLRVVEDATDTLRKWPPRGQEDLRSYLDDVLTRIHHLASPGSRPPATGQGTTEQGTNAFAPRPIGPVANRAGDVNGSGAAGAHHSGNEGDVS